MNVTAPSSLLAVPPQGTRPQLPVAVEDELEGGQNEHVALLVRDCVSRPRTVLLVPCCFPFFCFLSGNPLLSVAFSAISRTLTGPDSERGLGSAAGRPAVLRPADEGDPHRPDPRRDRRAGSLNQTNFGGARWRASLLENHRWVQQVAGATTASQTTATTNQQQATTPSTQQAPTAC